MKKLHALITTFGGAIILAGCGTENPTGSAAVADVVPRFDTGVMYGSGNSPSKETAAHSQGVAAAEQEGGVMYGSGN